MSVKKAVEIKLEMIWNPLVEMKISFVPIRLVWDPTDKLRDLEDLPNMLENHNLSMVLKEKDH